MINVLLAQDQQIFLWINHLPHPVLIDSIAMTFSGLGASILLWVLAGLWLFFHEEREWKHMFWRVFFAVAVAAIVVETIFKPIFGRIRPTMDMGAHIIAPASGYSFPSGHATVSWALAVVLASVEKTYAPLWFALALGISLSRIYLGVHFPSDVVAGALIGLAIGHITLHVIRVQLVGKGSNRKFDKHRKK